MTDHFQFATDMIQTDPWPIARHVFVIAEIGINHNGDGGPALAECDLALVVQSTVTGRIQETHITVGHALVELVEDLLLECGHLTDE